MQHDGPAATSFVGRIIGAALLRSDVYEEIEHDRSATGQAALVVAASSFAAGLGSITEDGVIGLVGLTAAALVGWVFYAYFTYWIGTRMLATEETSADWGEVARTLGFASAPRLIILVGLVPVLYGPAAIIAGIWVLVATIVALKAALEMGTGRAVATALLGMIPQIAVFAVIGAIVVELAK